MKVIIVGEVAGMVTADILRDDMPVSHWSTAMDVFLLDIKKNRL